MEILAISITALVIFGGIYIFNWTRFKRIENRLKRIEQRLGI